MAGLRLLVFDDGAGICLYVRLPGAHRIVVDCRNSPCRSSLALLRDFGELGPLTPLSDYMRPKEKNPQSNEWFKALNLLRGLVYRPRGAWIIWQPEPLPEPGFCLQAKIVPKARLASPSYNCDTPPLFVVGLNTQEVLQLGGPPSAWSANASLAMKLWMPEKNGLLLGGDLRPKAWQRILADEETKKLLAGASLFAAGHPSKGHTLGRCLKMAVLPWLFLGLMSSESFNSGQKGPRQPFVTPKVGALCLDVDEKGLIKVKGWPLASSNLVYKGLTRTICDPYLPAPWPLRLALANT